MRQPINKNVECEELAEIISKNLRYIESFIKTNRNNFNLSENGASRFLVSVLRLSNGLEEGVAELLRYEHGYSTKKISRYNYRECMAVYATINAFIKEDSFVVLRAMRNAFAHAARPLPLIFRLLEDEQTLFDTSAFRVKVCAENYTIDIFLAELKRNCAYIAERLRTIPAKEEIQIKEAVRTGELDSKRRKKHPR